MSRIRAWASGSWWKAALLIVAGLFLAIQLVPYGRDHGNPPVTQQVKYDSPRTEQLVDDACADCHSNITSWPIESNVAPMSWLIQRDVDEGREVLNFSEWNRGQPDTEELVESIDEGEMPPLQYKLLHGGARLSDAEQAELVDGLTRTYTEDPPGG
jgi:hypothetical protein